RWRWRQNRKKSTDTLASFGEQSEISKPDTVEEPRRRGRRSLPWILATALAVALLLTAAFLGSRLPDPKTSSEYLALQSKYSVLQADNTRISGLLEKNRTEKQTLEDGTRARENQVTGREQEVAKKEAAVQAAEQAVKKREEAVTSAEKQKAANTIREGTWTVGVDVAPGTYRTDSEVTLSCYWGIY